MFGACISKCVTVSEILLMSILVAIGLLGIVTSNVFF